MLPATKSALRCSRSAVPATKYALRGSQSAVPATKPALRGSRSAVPATKAALRGSQCDAPATKSALRGSQPATKSALQGSQGAVPATKSANEPHLQSHDSLYTVPVAKSDLVEDHRHVLRAVPAMKFAFRSKAAPIPGTCHEKSALDHENTRLPSRLPRKVTTMSENAHGATTRAQSLEARASPTQQVLRACAVEMHVDDFERHACTVNSHARVVTSI